MNSFYENFLTQCAKANKTPSGVAAAIGLSNAAASGWKKGKVPSEVTLEKLAQYFNVPASELMGEQKEKPTGNADGLTEEEMKFIEWFRKEASEKDKALVRMIVEGDK